MGSSHTGKRPHASADIGGAGGGEVRLLGIVRLPVPARSPRRRDPSFGAGSLVDGREPPMLRLDLSDAFLVDLAPLGGGGTTEDDGFQEAWKAQGRGVAVR